MAEQLRGGVCLHGLEVAGAYHAGKKIGLGKAGSLLLPALGRNLITNGDFEMGDLTGWTRMGDITMQTRENSNNVVEPHGGNYWVMMGNVGSVLQSSFFHVKPGSTLEISLWKAEAWEIRKHTVSMVFTDGTSVDILDLPAIDRKYLYQWLHFTTSWAVPENTTSAALRIRNTAYGYGRFDDISVRQII